MKILTTLTLTLAFAASAQATIYYVKAGAPSGNNGSSWSKAFNSLDQALSAAKKGSGNQIWIAAGTYKPSIVCSAACAGGYAGTLSQQDNLKTFYLISNVSIYGGFAGNETSLGQRNLSANPTILSGDLAGDDANTPSTKLSNKSDNVWHVLTADGVKGVVLDSLIISGGYAGGPDSGSTSGRPFFEIVSLAYSHAAGGGLLARHEADVSLSKVTFAYNAADGVNSTLNNPGFIAVTGVAPVIAAGGGAIAAEDKGTVITIRNSTFDRNTAVYPGADAGAINVQLAASVNVYSSTFTNNIADRDGGAIRGKDASLVYISGSTFENNAVNGVVIPDASGGAVGTINSNLTITNSAFRSNVSGFLSGGGGVIFHVIFDDGESYAFNVSNTVFDSNVAADIGGGGINILGFNPHTGTAAKISNCTFTNNTGGVGGAIYADGIPATITNSTFTGNTAWVNGGAIFASNFSDAAFAVSTPFTPAPVSLSNSTFSNNAVVGVPASAAAPPFAIFNAFAGGLVAINGDPNIDHPSVSSMAPGGGAVAALFDGVVKISNCSFFNNQAPGGSGGAILAGGAVGAPDEMNFANVKVSNSSCSGNTADAGSNSYAYPSAIVGAVQLSADGCN